MPDNVDAFETWTRNAQNAKTLVAVLDDAQRQFEQIIALLPDAPSSVSGAARNAFVLFLEGRHRLEEYASQLRPTAAEELWSWMGLQRDAATDFRESIETQKASLIEPSLLNAETIQRRKREDEEPFKQLAEGIVKEERERQLREGLPPGTTS